MDTENNLCKICNIDTFKYVCPRCNVVYCSVKCYKNQIHSDCSEAFYKECIQDYIKSEGFNNNNESKKKMLEVLQRVRNNDELNDEYQSQEDSDDDSESISERLAGINLDDVDSVWNRLTNEEQQEFITLVNNDDITEFYPIWKPWWCEKYSLPKVRFIDEEEPIPKYKEICPKISKSIPKLIEITKIIPSKFIFYNLINILGSYTIIARYFNGEYYTMPDEAVSILIKISKNLLENENFTSIDIALESVVQEAINCEFLTTSENIQDTIKLDVKQILEGPNEIDCKYYLQSALSDIYKLCEQAKKKKSSKTSIRGKSNFFTIFPENINTVSKCSKEIINKSMHKIKYLQSWAIDYYDFKLFL